MGETGMDEVGDGGTIWVFCLPWTGEGAVWGREEGRLFCFVLCCFVLVKDQCFHQNSHAKRQKQGLRYSI